HDHVHTKVPKDPQSEQAQADRDALEAFAAQVDDKTQVMQNNGAWLLAVHFRFDAATFQADASFEDLVELLQKTSDSVRVTLEGHTDHFGSIEYNQNLSERRAEAVKQALLDKLGAGFDKRIKTIGYGESRPLVSGTTREEVEPNRRV